MGERDNVIYRPAEKFTLVFYDQEKRTKTFEIGKSSVRLFTIVAAILFLLAFIALTFPFIFYRHNLESVQSKSSTLGQQLLNQDQMFLKKEIEYQDEIKKLRDNLKRANVTYAQSAKARSELGLNIPVITPIIGAKDLTSQKLINIEGRELKIENSRVQFNFRIINSRQVKMNGNLFVVFSQGSSLQFHGDNLSAQKMRDSFQLTSEMGEPFSAARLRPVNSSFQLIDSKNGLNIKEQFRLMVIIFNKDGDLIYKENINPAKL